MPKQQSILHSLFSKRESGIKTPSFKRQALAQYKAKLFSEAAQTQNTPIHNILKSLTNNTIIKKIDLDMFNEYCTFVQCPEASRLLAVVHYSKSEFHDAFSILNDLALKGDAISCKFLATLHAALDPDLQHRWHQEGFTWMVHENFPLPHKFLIFQGINDWEYYFNLDKFNNCIQNPTIKESLKWVERAAKENDLNSLFQLAIAYMGGVDDTGDCLTYSLIPPNERNIYKTIDYIKSVLEKTNVIETNDTYVIWLLSGLVSQDRHPNKARFLALNLLLQTAEQIDGQKTEQILKDWNAEDAMEQDLEEKKDDFDSYLILNLYKLYCSHADNHEKLPLVVQKKLDDFFDHFAISQTLDKHFYRM